MCEVSNIKWIRTTKENLYYEFKDCIEKILTDKSKRIVANIVCLVKYTKPKCNNGINREMIKNNKVEFIETKYKIMTSPLIIYWDRYNDEINFIFSNCSPLKFCRMDKVVNYE